MLEISKEYDIYTGKLKYRGIEFSFIFNLKNLKLIPPEDKKTISWEWQHKETITGIHTLADPITVGEKVLVGICNETNTEIIFILNEGNCLSFHNSIVIMKPIAYVVCRFHRDKFDRVSFSCPELNYIHPINQAYSIKIDDFVETGVAGITTQDFNASTTDKQRFEVDGKEVFSYFSVYRTIGLRISEPPLNFKTTLSFEFEATDDYDFIFQLWLIALKFIRFLCYRKNVFIPKVDIAAPYKDGKHQPFATMYIINQDGEVEEKALKDGRYIKQVHIAGKEGEILSDIANGMLYYKHIPERSKRNYDEARFIMIVTAFEWEFKRLYPNGVKKSEARIKAENEVKEELKRLIDESSGKKKKIYKKLNRQVRMDLLQSKIIQVSKDFSNIIDVFGKHLYHLNNEELKYSEMGKRLSDQRNHFAHGDLDKEFIELSFLDLMFMEYIVYAMQLKYYGVEDKEIQKSINELFRRMLAI